MTRPRLRTTARALLAAAVASLSACIAQPGPPSGAHVPWDEALALLYSGRVATVTQSHALEVTLVTRDGRILTTTEPRIDAVLDAVDTCGKPCAGIPVATE